MFEKMTYLEQEADDLRKLMLREPRGYPAANCNLILRPTRPEAAAGYVIMEHTEYPGMSGTNTIAVATVLIEVEGGKVKSVTFENVPAFPVHLDAPVEVPDLGTVIVDVSYGGMFYVIADAEPLGLQLTPDEAKDIIRVGEMIKAATQEQLDCVHPENPDIRGVTIAQLSAPSTNPRSDRKNTVIVSTGTLDWAKPSTWTGCLDRSPCGTGTCAKMAAQWAKGELPLNREFRHEGILGTVFTGRLLRETKVGDYPAVVPTLTGTAWITGFASYVLDPEDPFPTGYTVGDIWGAQEG
jgi:proline racemase